ncbi:hypothetical protein [Rubinisphaera sp.]|uniref:hypothetical protein n=1 Tax=Rubinisphaera sp. TaxID=2024857 RepID=UPI000C109C32|nr:hypothetical protein [Rubinisphaera sp.]MBV08870.1 hypothetical protein [Rubinisphaera sp.]HCS54965.1 hypothetical protein [Planctomycetaceae bacterium]|tara:strand:- start:15248 stop:15739 length:492 start_codon:yes stop_codon:yes gene_type:complete
MSEKDDEHSESPREIAPGVRLQFEFEELGRLKTIIRELIVFKPFVTHFGLKKKTLTTVSLKVSFHDAYSNLISQCLINRDEVDALLSYCHNSECEPLSLKLKWAEYRTRHGFVWIWDDRCRATSCRYQFLINSQKPAVIDHETHTEFLHLLSDFQDFCESLAP